MDTLSAILNWTYQAVATWYVAVIVGGVLILLAERLSRRAEPSDADVERAAERYRQWYGGHALSVIGDHILAASFAPDGRHKRFLRRVADRIAAGWIIADDREQAIATEREVTVAGLESRPASTFPDHAPPPLLPHRGRENAA
jgi:hypothetical protein